MWWTNFLPPKIFFYNLAKKLQIYGIFNKFENATRNRMCHPGSLKAIAESPSLSSQKRRIWEKLPKLTKTKTHFTFWTFWTFLSFEQNILEHKQINSTNVLDDRRYVRLNVVISRWLYTRVKMKKRGTNSKLHVWSISSVYPCPNWIYYMRDQNPNFLQKIR